jgi:dihydroxy-acid dehydratase
VDVDARRLDLDVAGEELAARRARWSPPPPRYASGAMAKYAALVSSASEGAITSGARLQAILGTRTEAILGARTEATPVEPVA